MYDWDSDYIKPMAMKSRETSEMLRCYSECYDYYRSNEFTARFVRMDNEVSRKLIKRINDDKLDYQLAAPGDHRLNYAERAIQDFKSHFISILSGTDSSFPKDKWDLLLDHAEVTLNIPDRLDSTPKSVPTHSLMGTSFLIRHH